MKNKRLLLISSAILLLFLIQKKNFFCSIETSNEKHEYSDILILKKNQWEELSPVVFSEQEGYWSINIAKPKNRNLIKP